MQYIYWLYICVYHTIQLRTLLRTICETKPVNFRPPEPFTQEILYCVSEQASHLLNKYLLLKLPLEASAATQLSITFPQLYITVCTSLQVMATYSMTKGYKRVYVLYAEGDFLLFQCCRHAIQTQGCCQPSGLVFLWKCCLLPCNHNV